MQHSISVIMPTYNGMQYIKQAIDSALNQSLPIYELIIVDDGSIDDTKHIIKEYGDQVRYIQQKNKGAASAYNTGIEAATGNYIAFLEHDDIWLPNKNALQIQFIKDHPEYSMIFSPVKLIKDGLPSKKSGIYSQECRGEYCFSDFFNRNRVLNCSSVMIKTTTLKSVGKLREDLLLSFDYDLWLRIAANHKIFCITPPLAQYRIHSSNLSNDNSDLIANESTLKAISTWKNNPLAHKLVGKNSIRDRILNLHLLLARDYSSTNKKNKELAHILSAVKLSPTNISLWKHYLWHNVNRQTRSHIKWYMNKLFRSNTP